MSKCRSCCTETFYNAFFYIAIPMCTLFSIVSGISLSVYSFKISLFLVKGDFALLNSNSTIALVETLLVSPLELIIAIAFMMLSGLVFWLYERIRRMRKIKRKEANLRQQHQDKQDDKSNDFDVVEM